MESRSYGSVKIFWLDKPKILGCLREKAERLGAIKPEIEEIWLFGSLARGDAVPGSDADVLLILSAHGKPFHERAPEYALGYCEIGVGLLPYTREEFVDLEVRLPRFYKTFLAERKELYRRSPG